MVAERPEVPGGQHHAPGCVEPVTVLEALLELSPGREDVHEAQAGSRHLVVRTGVELGERDIEAVADVLNIKGSEAVRQMLVIECAQMDEVEMRVEDVDALPGEVGDVEVVGATEAGDGRARIDGPVLFTTKVIWEAVRLAARKDTASK